MSLDVSTPLIDVIRQDIGDPVRRGHRLYWSCPFHEERTPSLTLVPDGQRYHCFGCGVSGDAIDWVMRRRGVSFGEAVGVLNSGPDCVRQLTHSDGRTLVSVKRANRPSPDFSSSAMQIVEASAETLWADTGTKARAWLTDRGLTEKTIRCAQLGFNPTTGKQNGLFVERGVTIPWMLDGSVTAIKIRRPDGDPKYIWVGGGCRKGLYLGHAIRPGMPTLIVEGEFDALLGWQELRDSVNVATLGSATNRPDQTALLQLLSSPLLFICYDQDEAGHRGARYWERLTSRARIVTIPQGKDLTEFHLKGGDLRAWVECELYTPGPHATRHPTLAVNQ